MKKQHIKLPSMQRVKPDHKILVLMAKSSNMGSEDCPEWAHAQSSMYRFR